MYVCFRSMRSHCAHPGWWHVPTLPQETTWPAEAWITFAPSTAWRLAKAMCASAVSWLDTQVADTTYTHTHLHTLAWFLGWYQGACTCTYSWPSISVDILKWHALLQCHNLAQGQLTLLKPGPRTLLWVCLRTLIKEHGLDQSYCK